MRRYVVRIEAGAENDLIAIRNFIEADSGAAIANSFLQRLVQHLAEFDIFPNRGTLRSDVGPNLRFIGWDRTVTIAFEALEAKGEVWILAIGYRGVDLTARFES